MPVDIQTFQQNIIQNFFPIATAFGCTPGVISIKIWGYVSNINQLSDIWPTGFSYIFPIDGGQNLEIVSDNVADTSKIHIDLLNEIGIFKTEKVNLNGTTPVSVPGRCSSVQRAYVDDNTSVLGMIMIRGTGNPNSNIFAIILPADQQTTQCQFLVPNDKIAIITKIGASLNASGGADDDVILKLIVAKSNKIFRTQFRFGLQKRGNSVITTHIIEPLIVQPLSKIRIIAIPSASLDVSFSYSMCLVDKYLVSPEILDQ